MHLRPKLVAFEHHPACSCSKHTRSCQFSVSSLACSKIVKDGNYELKSCAKLKWQLFAAQKVRAVQKLLSNLPDNFYY